LHFLILFFFHIFDTLWAQNMASIGTFKEFVTIDKVFIFASTGFNVRAGSLLSPFLFEVFLYVGIEFWAEHRLVEFIEQIVNGFFLFLIG